MNRILEGLRVVESSAFIAAPYAGMTLAQMGADVIRVDPIGGGLDYRRWPVTNAGESLYWAGLNKAKRSVCVDLRNPEGRELVAALIDAPDENGGVFLTNLPTAAPIDYETLRRRRADVIMLSISGSRDGATAVDYTVNAAAGFPLVTGPAGLADPVNHVLPAWDLLTGLTAALGLVAAERHRRATGEGQLLRLALADIAFATAGHLGYIAEVQINRAQRPRLGNSIYGTFGRDFMTKDGERVIVVAVTAKQWDAIGKATGLGENFAQIERMLQLDFRKEADRYEARDILSALIERWVRTKTLSEIRGVFDAHGLCWGPYQSFQQLVEADPRCSTANPIFAEIEQPGIGRYLVPGCCIDFGAAERIPSAPAPRLGQHTDEVLMSVLGLSEGQVGALHDRRVVGGPK